ncbi:hypothetical protein WMO40_21655 [Bacillaceae bacterium CLA-AA-H227]|uniref:Uncharacterized protein n=1 Tax=Robertmurraya yapensis (ex Hitch et al 2024) TaxID=3133160 RepID=A0ACC6SGW9_9BACI
MERLTNQLFIYIGLLGSILLGSLIIESRSYFIGMIVLMMIMGLLSIFMRTMYSFAILIAIILGLAFYNVGTSWYFAWDISKQGINIAVQALLSFAALMAWIYGYTVRKNSKVLQALNSELLRLRKYEEHTGILTLNEFLEQAEILFTGMKRRKETGFLVHILIKESKEYKQRILRDKLSKAVLESIRAKYDLAGQLHPSAIILYLHNTTEQGVEIVMERLKGKLDHISLQSISFEIARVPENWNETREQLKVFIRSEHYGSHTDDYRN